MIAGLTLLANLGLECLSPKILQTCGENFPSTLVAFLHADSIFTLQLFRHRHFIILNHYST